MANLLINGDFEEPTGGPTTLTGVGVAGQSAAPSWTTWNNVEAVTTTDILPSTAPNGGSQMLHVSTTGQGCGLVQQYQPTNSGPALVVSSVLVFVNHGLVGMGTGNNGDTNAYNAVCIQTGQWTPLTAPNGDSPANEFIVYAVSAGGADYYVDNASVLPDPCQSIREELASVSAEGFPTLAEFEHAVHDLVQQLIACERENHELG
jgi:hypothetical protein